MNDFILLHNSPQYQLTIAKTERHTNPEKYSSKPSTNVNTEYFLFDNELAFSLLILFIIPNEHKLNMRTEIRKHIKEAPTNWENSTFE